MSYTGVTRQGRMALTGVNAQNNLKTTKNGTAPPINSNRQCFASKNCGVRIGDGRATADEIVTALCARYLTTDHHSNNKKTVTHPCVKPLREGENKQ